MILYSLSVAGNMICFVAGLPNPLTGLTLVFRFAGKDSSEYGLIVSVLDLSLGVADEMLKPSFASNLRNPGASSSSVLFMSRVLF